MNQPQDAPHLQETMPGQSASIDQTQLLALSHWPTRGQAFADRYEIVDSLGQGGMGTVFHVTDLELGEDIALKLLKPEIASQPGSIERFRREVKLARRIAHRNVARTYDMGRVGDVRFLTMELIQGVTLSSWIEKEGRFSFSESLRVVGELALGLAAAHSVGVIHRDLKPDNIMRASERTVITDFGIARLAPSFSEPQEQRHTMGMAIGTPAYMAPEQVEGQDLDGRADVYALGILWFEMLTGKLPFHGENPYAMALARLQQAPQHVRTLDDSIPEQVSELLHHMLARRRNERPDAHEVAARIAKMRGEGERARAGWSAHDLSTPSSKTPSQLITVTNSQWARLAAHNNILILPFRMSDPTHQGMATELRQALADAVSNAKVAKALTPSLARIDDDDETLMLLAEQHAAHWVLDCSFRVNQQRVRFRMHMLDAAQKSAQFTQTLDFTLDTIFELEDKASQLLVDTLRTISSPSGRSARGPSDPSIREIYDRGRRSYRKSTVASARESTEIFREGLQKYPDSVWLLSGLGASLVRLWVVSEKEASLIFREADDLCLRALAIDSSIGETFLSIGILRLNQGDYRAALRSFREALVLAPHNAEACEYVGRMCAEAGYLDDAIHYLQKSLTMEPDSTQGYLDLARCYSLKGEPERARATYEKALVRFPNHPITTWTYMRFSLWFEDLDLARHLLERMSLADHPEDLKAFAVLLPLAQALAGFIDRKDTAALLDQFIQNAGLSKRRRAFFTQLSIELLCGANEETLALDKLEQLANLSFIDIAWLDHCPLFKSMRQNARFARVRTIVAERVRELWS